MVEEPLKIKKKDQISFDEQEAIRLQAKFDKEVRLAREKDKANTTSRGARRVDYLREVKVVCTTLRRKNGKFFAAKRAEEKRNKPPTKAQQRSIMTTYRKNMAGWKPKDLKNKSFANIQDLFDKAMKRVNTFVDMDTELVKESSKKAEAEIAQESSSKRAGDELEQDPSKKQKVDDDKETEELKKCMEIILDNRDDVTIEATPLSTKSPSIVDWKIIKEGKIGYYQIIRADGNSKRYSSIIQMLKSFDREDLETLWKLVKAKHGYTRLEERYERVL
ncbi:hypothetical protein Tco_1402505 [Tanacetum coccineum]